VITGQTCLQLFGGACALGTCSTTLTTWTVQEWLWETNLRVTIDGDRAEAFSKGYALNILRRPNGSEL
jgi:hypothetical protein